MNLEHISVLCYWTAVMWERGGNDRTGMLMRSLLQSINDHRGVSKADPCTSTTVPLRFHTHEWGFKKSLKIFTSYTFCYYPEFVCIRCYLMLISLHFLRSSVCAGPEELLWPAGLQRCWASLCLAPRPPGISRGASSRCGGVLLLPVHPRVALRGLSRVRIAAVFRGDVRGHYGVCVRDGGFGNGWKREEVKKASGEIEEWHISGGKRKSRERKQRGRKTPLFLPGGGGNSEMGCHVDNCLHLHLSSPRQRHSQLSEQSRFGPGGRGVPGLLKRRWSWQVVIIGIKPHEHCYCYYSILHCSS